MGTGKICDYQVLGARGRGGGLPRAQRDFRGGGGNVLGLDCGGDSKTVKVCQDALTCPPKEENFQRTKMRRKEKNRQSDLRDGRKQQIVF